MNAVPGILPTLLEMICFFSTPTIDVEPALLAMTRAAKAAPLQKNRAGDKTLAPFFGDPAEIRTPDTLLKRQVLCQLSYWVGY